MSTSILIAQNLAKQYKKNFVVNDISLQIKAGEVVGLLGPNGAGKTTSFYMIVGLVNCDKGKVLIDNHDITHSPMHERARLGLGYLPQETSIFRKLTVEKNILSILELRKDLNPEQRKEKLNTLLHDFHIEHLRDHMAMTLSGGEKRRVEIARALAMDPKFILLDEPFAGIDPISVIDLKRIISQLVERGIGVLITDHNVRDTLAICQQAYIVNAGKIIANGEPKVILENSMVRDVYLGHDFEV